MTRPDEITEAFKSIMADCEAIRRRCEHTLAMMQQAQTITEAKAGQPIRSDNIRRILPANVTLIRPDDGDVV